jgi:hypothetical protein
MRNTPWRRARRRGSIRAVSAALVVAAAAAALTVSATAAGQAAPRTTSPPTIEGKFQVDETVTATNGGWANDPTEFTYKWQRCNREGSGCANIAGATAKTYKLTTSDIDHSVRVLVTAANSDGKSTANSHPSPIISGSQAPRNTQRPVISGTTQVGQTLTVSNGEWTGGVRSFTYQWQRCDENGNNCADVAGATAKTYGVRAADEGKALRAEVTAENAAGKTTVNTDRSAQVRPATTPAPPKATNGCDGSRFVAAATLASPVRLLIDKFRFTPNVVTLSTRQVVGRIHVADTCGRSVVGANVWATAIPYNQTSTVRGTTASDGWATLRFNILRGFPANPGRQQILAMLVRATKPGGSVLAGVSTRRALRLSVDLHHR